MQNNSMDINDLSFRVINGAIAVHRELGPGLLESVYQSCLEAEFKNMGISIKTEVPLPVFYRGQEVSHEGYRLDILVEDKIIIELKSVERVKPVHLKQLLTYLRLSNRRLGLLINFNEPLLKDGVTRVANNLVE